MQQKNRRARPDGDDTAVRAGSFDDPTIEGEATMKKDKIKFYVEPKGFLAQSAVILMALAVVFRLIGCWGLWTDEFYAVTQIMLPIAAGLLFIALVLLLGKHALWTTSLPVLMGVAFFILKSFSFESWLHTVPCLVLYVLVAVLYVSTVFAFIRTKWLLVPLFALPFLYHVFVEDLAALRDTVHPVTFAAGMQEMSVLCIMLSLLFLSLCMIKKKPELEEAELPKMKDPIVIPPEPKPEEPAEEIPAEPQTLAEAEGETPAVTAEGTDGESENV